jgi:signal peptidase II
VRKRHARAVSLIVFAVVACMVVVSDLLTKALAVSALSGGKVQPVVPGIVDFQLVYNTGAAWGMFEGARIPFLIIAALAIVAMVLYLVFAHKNAALTLLGLGLIAGGAIGNAIERALSGKVVDFIHPLFIEFPLFNIADSAITIGTILFMIALLFGGRDVPREQQERVPSAKEPGEARTTETRAGESEEGRRAVSSPAGESPVSHGKESPVSHEEESGRSHAKEPGDAPL